MKFTLVLYAACLGFLFSCNRNELEETLTKTIILPNHDEVRVPDAFELVALPAHDSAFGKIVSTEDSTFTLFYDIGLLASEYVDPGSSSKKKGKAVNQDFFYDRVDKTYLSGGDCCYYITFRETGPANFIAFDNKDFDLVLAIMESYKSN